MTPTKIEWADYVWNPVTGCLNGCDYCYARRMAQRLRGRFGYPTDEPFKPTFHKDRLRQPYEVKKPSKVFVCSMGDLFGDWVCLRTQWVFKVLDVARDNPQHTFMFLTKCPDMMMMYGFPDNAWCGISAETYKRMKRWLYYFKRMDATVRFISFEPLHGEIKGIPGWLDWIIIGAETGNRKGRIEPKHEWIESLTQQADNHNIPIFHKDNLAPYYEGELRREYPRV